MFNQGGYFNGIDTCSMKNAGKFDFDSPWLNESEARYIEKRLYINSFINHPVKEKNMSPYVAHEKHLFAHHFPDNLTYSKYCNGATYVPLEGKSIIKKEISNPFISVIVDDNKDCDTEAILISQKYWPAVIYPCQTTSNFGAHFYEVPSFKTNGIFNNDSGVPWVVATLLTIIESLWRLVENIQLQT